MGWCLSIIFNMFAYYQKAGLNTSLDEDAITALRKNLPAAMKWIDTSLSDSAPLGVAIHLLFIMEKRLQVGLQKSETFNYKTLLLSFVSAYSLSWKLTEELAVRCNYYFIQLLPTHFGLPSIDLKELTQSEFNLMEIVQHQLTPLDPAAFIHDLKKYCDEKTCRDLQRKFWLSAEINAFMYAIPFLDKEKLTIDSINKLIISAPSIRHLTSLLTFLSDNRSDQYSLAVWHEGKNHIITAMQKKALQLAYLTPKEAKLGYHDFIDILSLTTPSNKELLFEFNYFFKIKKNVDPDWHLSFIAITAELAHRKIDTLLINRLIKSNDIDLALHVISCAQSIEQVDGIIEKLKLRNATFLQSESTSALFQEISPLRKLEIAREAMRKILPEIQPLSNKPH